MEEQLEVVVTVINKVTKEEIFKAIVPAKIHQIKEEGMATPGFDSVVKFLQHVDKIILD